MASLPEARDSAWATAHGLRALAIDAAAGTVGGCAGILIGSPFDVLKTRAQATAASVASGASVATSSTAGGGGGLRGLFHAARGLVAAEGISGLFAGSFISCLGQAPNNALIFAVYGGTLRALEPASGDGNVVDGGYGSLVATYVAGTAAGAAQSLVLAPFEGVKVMQQMTRAPLLATARAMAKRGLLTRGMAATFWRDAPTFGVYFSTFEAARGAYSGRMEPPVWVTLAAGGLAGVLSWIIALPADVVKSRVQAAPLDSPSPRMRDVAAGLWREAGAAGFFKGALPVLLRAVPVNAVTFLVYDKSLREFQRWAEPPPPLL